MLTISDVSFITEAKRGRPKATVSVRDRKIGIKNSMRRRIYDFLVAMGPATGTEIAEALETPMTDYIYTRLGEMVGRYGNTVIYGKRKLRRMNSLSGKYHINIYAALKINEDGTVGAVCLGETNELP